MSRLIRAAVICSLIAGLTAIIPLSVSASDEPLPAYLQQAQSAVAQVLSKGADLPALNDDILIAQNSLRNAEAEYKKNLGWSGKLDQKAEPTVRYLAEAARLQAAVLLARIGKQDQDKEKSRLDGLITVTKSKIKVFDDLVAQVKALKKQSADQTSQITSLNAKVASLTAELSAKGSVITSSDQKTGELLKALDEQKKATASSEQRVAALTQELEGLKQQTAQLQATGEQLAAEKRIKAFEAEAGKLGGIVKTTSAGLSVTFPRSQMLKTTGKSTTLTPAGTTTIVRLADLLKTYPEYRIKLRVHGFGQPSRHEDAAATDQMARFIREGLLTKGKLEQATVEALGVGSAEPVYPKGNVEGNRRVEIIFVKK
ncbi:hypothetical protein FY034_12110 [Trichlorobacter lovleyi]|uniref:hypothetical protein n=1 Tax=Trichlorobacter lovleyi TaxID=313985 RepID=UPI0022404FB2|nr:hypothetical protein [Trichlorobacter lovleyi]QOX79653.1 hypothetical protein FY034_12110 [Trichlorobacter lovleyi]